MSEEEIEILKDFINNENTIYCYDWNGFDHKTILPLIEKLLENYSEQKEEVERLKGNTKVIGRIGGLTSE